MPGGVSVRDVDVSFPPHPRRMAAAKPESEQPSYNTMPIRGSGGFANVNHDSRTGTDMPHFSRRKSLSTHTRLS